jgi:hypothetical protein
VRDVPACFNAETKILRHLFPPGLKIFFAGKAIKTVIQFHGVEATRVPRRAFSGTESLQDKIGNPMFVVPSGSANMLHRLWQLGCGRERIYSVTTKRLIK